MDDEEVNVLNNLVNDIFARNPSDKQREGYYLISHEKNKFWMRVVEEEGVLRRIFGESPPSGPCQVTYLKKIDNKEELGRKEVYSPKELAYIDDKGRTCAVIVYFFLTNWQNKITDVLLIRETRPGWPDGGKYSVVAGNVDNQDCKKSLDYKQVMINASLRELKEESGIDITRRRGFNIEVHPYKEATAYAEYEVVIIAPPTQRKSISPSPGTDDHSIKFITFFPYDKIDQLGAVGGLLDDPKKEPIILHGSSKRFIESFVKEYNSRKFIKNTTPDISR